MDSKDISHYFGEPVKLFSTHMQYRQTCIMSLYIGDVVKVFGNLRERIGREHTATITSIKIKLFSTLSPD